MFSEARRRGARRSNEADRGCSSQRHILSRNLMLRSGSSRALIAAAQVGADASALSSVYAGAVLQSRSKSYCGALERLFRLARDARVPIVIEGETGTGKTTIARYLHHASPRAHGPFQHVLSCTLDDGLASSELFGHVAGAFTDARCSRL